MEGGYGSLLYVAASNRVLMRFEVQGIHICFCFIILGTAVQTQHGVFVNMCALTLTVVA